MDKDQNSKSPPGRPVPTPPLLHARNGGAATYSLPASSYPVASGSDTEEDNDEDTNQLYLSKMNIDSKEVNVCPRPIQPLLHARNGGAATYFLPASSYPVASGSDTEEDDDEDINQFYLNNMDVNYNKRVKTVFGKGANVWRSHSGEGETDYADYNTATKRKIRNDELWGPTTVRKKGTETNAKPVQKDKQIQKASKEDKGQEEQDTHGENQVTVRPPRRVLPAPPSPLPPAVPYRPRNPDESRFHHGSAAIDPEGAHNRPIKPLPVRRRGTALSLLAAPQNTGDLHSAASAPRRVFSGSFGSFDTSGASRFDERGYRLLPTREAKTKKETDKEETDKKETNKREKDKEEKGQGKVVEGTVDVFKGKPWLKR